MTTDRAKRYAANRAVTDDKRSGCLFCCSKKNLTVDHLSGDESDGDPRNLAWLCKSCNTRKGAAFRKAGVGRPTNQYNPCLGLSTEERRNYEQLGFSFPPRAEYDRARAADRKRKQREHAAVIARRREERKADRARRASEKKAEMRGLRDRLSSVEAEIKRAVAYGDKDAARSLREDYNETLGELRDYTRRHAINPAGITTPGQWSEAVRAVLGQPSYMSVSAAASRIRATPPGQRRKLARAMRPNPGAVPTYKQYAFAVSGFDHGRGDPALGEVIHRTPKATRASYARMIAASKREHGTEHRTGRYRETARKAQARGQGPF